MTLLSCRDPPGARVTARDRDSGRVLLNRIVDRTITGIDIGSGATLDVTLNQLTNAIGVKVHTNHNSGSEQNVHWNFVTIMENGILDSHGRWNCRQTEREREREREITSVLIAFQ